MNVDKQETELYNFRKKSDCGLDVFLDMLNGNNCNTRMLIEFYWISITNNELETALWVLQYINVGEDSTLLIPHEISN